VLLLADGRVHEMTDDERVPPSGTVLRVFRGGEAREVDEREGAILEGAGFGDHFFRSLPG
jgi:hypothetical protein